jgi:hypothetical protein
MIEYITLCAYVEKIKVNKQVEDIKLSNHMKNMYNINKDDNSTTQYIIYSIISLVISIFTANLAYNCNLKSDIVYKIIATLFGFFFSFIYLIYYFIRHILMRQKC